MSESSAISFRAMLSARHKIILLTINVNALNFARSAYGTALKISKLVFTVVGFAQVQVVTDAYQCDASAVPPAVQNQTVLLQKALQSVPNPSTECVLRSTAHRLGQSLSCQVSA
jgi:ubiquitin carboxyl-terminal hydrolase 9/24